MLRHYNCCVPGCTNSHNWSGAPFLLCIVTCLVPPNESQMTLQFWFWPSFSLVLVMANRLPMQTHQLYLRFLVETIYHCSVYPQLDHWTLDYRCILIKPTNLIFWQVFRDLEVQGSTPCSALTSYTGAGGTNPLNVGHWVGVCHWHCKTNPRSKWSVNCDTLFKNIHVDLGRCASLFSLLRDVPRGQGIIFRQFHVFVSIEQSPRTLSSFPPPSTT